MDPAVDEPDAEQAEFERKADKVGGCLFDGCFYGSIGCLPVFAATIWMGLSIWHVV